MKISLQPVARSLQQAVGIDIVDFVRAKRFVKNHSDHLETIFSSKEVLRFKRSKNRLWSFALMFAAKEAASKAMGVAVRHPRAFLDYHVQVVNNLIHVDYCDKKGKKTRLQCIPFTLKSSIGVVAWRECVS